MASGMIDTLAAGGGSAEKPGFAVAPGIVTNNLDLTGDGRVQVRIPSRPGFEPWARLLGVGGGPDRGFVWTPQRDDEVLVAFHHDDPTDAYVLGGLWNSRDKAPLDGPQDFLTKRKLKTGLSKAPGHEVEFDDVKQSISIKTTTGQKITLDPTTIELANTAGTLKITLDNTTQTVRIEGVNIELKATARLTIGAVNIDIKGDALTSVSGAMVKIN